MLPNDILGICALVTSVCALSVSWLSWNTSTYAAKNDVTAQLRGWCERVVDLLSDAGALCDRWNAGTDEATFIARHTRILTRTSSLLDIGRLFFPNAAEDSYGVDKGPERRGIRPQILDVLALSFELTRCILSSAEVADDRRQHAFRHLRRVLVFAIQRATSAKSPRTVPRYEEYLRHVKVLPLPEEIKALTGDPHGHYELIFDPELKLSDD